MVEAAAVVQASVEEAVVAALGQEDVRKPVVGLTSNLRLRDYTWSEWKDPFASVGRNDDGTVPMYRAEDRYRHRN